MNKIVYILGWWDEEYHSDFIMEEAYLNEEDAFAEKKKRALDNTLNWDIQELDLK